MKNIKLLSEEEKKALLDELRPHGKWIKQDEDGDYFSGYVCSECGHMLPYTDEYDYTTDFCPDCGANMRKPTKGE